MAACLRMTKKITKNFVRYKFALERIYQNPNCICGAGHPDEWEYKLNSEDKPYHNEDCPSVIAGIALGELEKV